jgi:hypothetical protein
MGSKMAKLTKLFSEIDAAINIVDNSEVSQADLVKLHAITVTAVNLNLIVKRYQSEVKLDQTNANEYSGGILSPANEFATFNLTTFGFVTIWKVELTPYCDMDLSIDSCTALQVKVKLGDARASEIYQTGVKLVLMVVGQT